MKGTLLLLVFTLIGFLGISQQTFIIQGKLLDDKGNPIPFANLQIPSNPTSGTSSKENGTFQLNYQGEFPLVLVVSHINYLEKQININSPEDLKTKIRIEMTENQYNLKGFQVETKRREESNMEKINPKLLSVLPSASGNFESILMSQPGVVSNNELSSQYSVRGGNFDENLVYVNDIQIYRPFLIRSGQQEGLSFVNADLTASVLFSSGGFDAKYGDKLSSVLDIEYKAPTQFSGSVNLSLLGASAHIEDVDKSGRFTHIHGIRYRTNAYLLGALDTDGQYKPTFMDYQTFMIYDLADKWELNFLANVSSNRYQFTPKTRETEFGTIQQVLRLTVFFEGQEIDQYQTSMGALSLNHRPNKNTNLKLIASAFNTIEQESFDILGAYRLDELENDLGDDNFGDVKFNRGVGAFIDHARNELNARVGALEHKGEINKKNKRHLWGIKFQYEDIVDQLLEWRIQDSAGFSLPHPPDSVGYTTPSLQEAKQLNIEEYFSSSHALKNQRWMGFFQENRNFILKDTSSLDLNAGIRFNYWTYSQQVLISPRVSLRYYPSWNKNLSFRFSTGLYSQHPFYREMRRFDGSINQNIKAQESIHFVLGGDLQFIWMKRPFKYTTELYYKYMDNIIPYEVDNVRIRYYATNNAKADAKGIDMKLHGEFVKGVDSWVSLSVMNIREDLKDDFYYEYYNDNGEKITSAVIDQVATDSIRFEPGYIRRPTDQRVNFGLFFQDYIPGNERFKMHLNLLYGSGMPFGPPSFDRYRDTLKMPPYRRVDIGFSAQLLSSGRKLPKNNPLRYFNSIWASLEVFNLLAINNTISYLWISDITGNEYAVPNFLTNRRVNIRFSFRF